MSNNQIFDEFAKMASGAMNAAGGMKGEAENLFSNQIEFMCQKFGLVQKQELDAALERLAKLEERVLKLEEQAHQHA